MAITSGVNNKFKRDVMLEEHNLSSDTIKIALVSATTSASNGGPDTYTSITAEINGTGYTAGGEVLSNVAVTQVSSSGVVDFDDVLWTDATFTARGAIIYNSTNSGKIIAVYDFGGDKTVTSGTFTLSIPTATSSSAIIRLN